MKGMMPVHEKAVVPRRLHPRPYRGHVRLSTRWVARMTLLDLCKIGKLFGSRPAIEWAYSIDPASSKPKGGVK